MGIALWVAAGAIATGIARIIPIARPPAWRGELLAALVAAIACGLLATYLDFGGWKEPDWRAGLFAFLGGFAAVGLMRGLRS